jgi:UPF0271 protein
MSENKKAVVLDTSAFIAGFDPSSIDADIYSVPAVREELVEESLPKIRFDAAVEKGRLRLIEPSLQYINAVKESSRDVADLPYLSQTDIQVLALAVQLRQEGFIPTIITDDYSIQNVACKMNISFAPLLTFGIRFYLKWTVYCPGCRKRYPSDCKLERCEVCGTQLRRKPIRKRLIRRK